MSRSIERSHDGIEIVDGVVDTVRYRNNETRYTVLVTTVDGDEVIVVGERDSAVEKGARFTAHGRWVDHPKHGRQFSFENLDVAPPTTDEQVIARLMTYPGVGEATAKAIVEQFRARTWEVMARSIDALLLIPGIGKSALRKIRDHHERQHGPVAKIRNRLIDVGAPPSLAKGIHAEFGKQSIAKLDDQPYAVARKVPRFGFALAERFARASGLDPENDERVDAGVIQAMHDLRPHGHTCTERGPLMVEADRIFRAREVGAVSARAIEASIGRLLETSALRERYGVLFLRGVDMLEQRVAGRILSLCRPVSVWDVGRLTIRGGPGVQRVELSKGQRAAVEAVARSGVTIVTGGPGTGKSTTMAAVIETAAREGVEVTLCAPTGRAARRLSEATGKLASTIHRLLRPTPDGGFHHDEARPLRPGLVVVDEGSMLDLELADALLGALTREHRLLLVGDVDQLPSVGAGDVLRDMIDAASAGANISVVRLEEIFRQDEGSSITANAHRILRGEDLVSDDPRLGCDGQFYMLEAATVEGAQRTIVKLASYRVPVAYDLEPEDGVQVLCPMHKGPVGTEAINAKLQHRYHRDEPAFYAAQGRRFCVGDRVMQTRNDYERNVFNGDIGTVTVFDDKTIVVDFDGAAKTYERFHARALQLAYAMTIHKSQGGEFPAVIIPVFPTRMWTANLLYTAVTRAQRLCILVGRPEEISRAVRTGSAKRWTRLAQRLAGGGRGIDGAEEG